MAEKVMFDFEFGGNSKETADELNTLKEELESIKGELSGIKDAQKDTTKALSGIAKGFSGIGLAIKSAGIGLLLSTFEFLKDVMMKNQRVIDTVTIATEALSIVFNQVTTFAIDLGESIVDAFSNPKEAILELWDVIKTNIVNRFEGLINQFKTAGKILQGVFTLDWDLIKEGAAETTTNFIQLATGLDEVQQSEFAETLKEGAKAIISVGTEAVNTATKITALRNEVVQLEADQRLLNFTYLKEQESQRQIRDDVTKTLAVRIEANEKLAESLEKQLADEQGILDKKLELAQFESDADAENIEKKAEVTNALAELADLEERINGFRSEQLTNRTALELEQKAILDELKLAELTEKEAEFEALKQEYEAKIELARLAGAETEAIEEQYLANKKALQDGFAQEELDAINKQNNDIEKENDKKNKALEASDKAKNQAINNGLQMIEGLFAGNEKAEKAFALAKIGIDTAKAISSLTANSEANPANAVSFGGAGIIQFATGLIRIVANIASAKKLLNSKGSSPSATPASSGGGGNNAAAQATQQLSSQNFGGNAAQFDLAASTSSFSQAPLQAFVVQQDVEDQSEMSTQIQNRATL
jgi:hypothetical protein